MFRASRGTPATRRNCALVAADCRKALRHCPDGVVDCVITSPPYGRLKDYGGQGQIGFGQSSIDDYLRDIDDVLKELHRICKNGSALWMVLDTVKQSGHTLALPWEVISRARKIGWEYHDLVIWDKGRSLPWSHVGRFRGVFEYVLLFGKGKLRHFALNDARELDHLSPYWVRFPERYNPQGKAPTDIWHFPIPVQGSWSRNGIRHFCPFPIPLVARMISLTTKPGDTVLDPFAGTGTVVAVARMLGRRGAGIDVNGRFVERFRRHGYDLLKVAAKRELNRSYSRSVRNSFRSLIPRLRMLKYPRTLFAQLGRADRLGLTGRESIGGFVVLGKSFSGSRRRNLGGGALGELRVLVLVRSSGDVSLLRKMVQEVVSVPPLSKFGLKCQVELVDPKGWKSTTFGRRLSGDKWCIYLKGIFNSYHSVLDPSKMNQYVRALMQNDKWKIPPVIANIRVKVPANIAD